MAGLPFNPLKVIHFWKGIRGQPKPARLECWFGALFFCGGLNFFTLIVGFGWWCGDLDPLFFKAIVLPGQLTCFVQQVGSKSLVGGLVPRLRRVVEGKLETTPHQTINPKYKLVLAKAMTIVLF